MVCPLRGPCLWPRQPSLTEGAAHAVFWICRLRYRCHMIWPLHAPSKEPPLTPSLICQEGEVYVQTLRHADLQACTWGGSCSFPQNPQGEHAGPHVLLLLPPRLRRPRDCWQRPGASLSSDRLHKRRERETPHTQTQKRQKSHKKHTCCSLPESAWESAAEAQLCPN